MMDSYVIVFLSIFIFTKSIGGTPTNDIYMRQKLQQRQSLGTNLVDPYYAYNPDYMGGNMPNVQSHQNNVNSVQTSLCTCSCGDMSYGPPVPCSNAQTCVAYCLQAYPGQCTLVNTYGCCGSSCQYFQAQSLDTQFCTCNCGGQQLSSPMDTCVSSQTCITRCLTKYPQVCTVASTQACCGQDCQSYSQTVVNSCACRCQGSTHYPSPKCANAQGCISTCMTTYSECITGQTEGCCGSSCSGYIPTCQCNCGSDFTRTMSIPCQNSKTCLETCINSHGACTQENTQACCGNDCLTSYSTCSCMCGNNQNIPLPYSCGSSQQCVQACLRSVPQCNIANVQGCCGNDCSGYIPTCQCECGSNIFYASSNCASAEQCTNACISQYNYACTPSNTIGCCNGTSCTRQNRFIDVSHGSTFRLATLLHFMFMINYFLKV